MTSQEVADLVGGTLDGDPTVELSGGNSIEVAGENEIAFAEAAAAHGVARSAAGCLLVPADAPSGGPPSGCRAVIRVSNPRWAFARVLQALHPRPRPPAGVHPSAVVAPSAALGAEVSIGAHSVIGASASIGPRTVIGSGVSVGDGSVIGGDVWIHSNVTIYSRVSIGERVIVHSGCVLGADGFGYALGEAGHEKFPQLGGVRIGDDVEIGANSCVDRAALNMTVIGDGSKLDNMVHIAHNCVIGKHVVIAAQTGLSGGVTVGDHAIIGGQVGIGDKVTIEPGAVLGSGCGVLPSKTIHSGEKVWGTPARPLREHLRKLALLGRLPEVLRQWKDLRRRIEHLESK